MAQTFLLTHHDSIGPGTDILPQVYADIQFVPDPSSYRICPWNPKLAFVFAKFINLDGTPVEACTRTLLSKACKQLKEEFGLELKVGVELEFFLFKKTADGYYIPAETGTYGVLNALP